MSGRTTRASVREELARAANNASMLGSHLLKIEDLCKVGNRPDIAVNFNGVSEMAATLQSILLKLRETI